MFQKINQILGDVFAFDLHMAINPEIQCSGDPTLDLTNTK